MRQRTLTVALVAVLAGGLGGLSGGLILSPHAHTSDRTAPPVTTPMHSLNPPTSHSAPAETPRNAPQASAASTPPPAGSEPVAEISLDQPGSVHTPNTGVNLPLLTAGGNDVAYVTVTVTTPIKLTDTAAAAARAASNTPGSGSVYVVRVTTKLLGTIRTHEDPITLDRNNLQDFTIFNHPGADPLTNTSTLPTAGCAGLPASLPAMRAGSKLSWCITAFATSTDLPAEGTQYVTKTGPYTSPVVWMSSPGPNEFQ